MALAAAWLLFELLRPWLVRRYADKTAGLRLAAWAIRPWGVWGLFNASFRWQWERGFNNRLTFPFFANPWRDGESLAAAVARLLATPSVWIWGAVVLAIGAALAGILHIVLRQERLTRRRAVGLVAAAFVASVALHLSVACLPNGAGSREDVQGSLLSSWHAHSTMLYAVPLVESSTRYLEGFAEVQPSLRRTIHGLSHPPVASLSMYWVGCAVGARGMDIREDATRLRYALGLTLIESLNVFLLYGLGASLFGSRRVGVVAAVLWLVSPATVTYSTFAQNGLYAVVFITGLLLSWHTIVRGSRSLLLSVALGVVLFLLSLICYSWCLVAAIFGMFAGIVAWRRGWGLGGLVRRAGTPALIMLVMLLVFLLRFRMDYFAVYRASRQYVGQWYVFKDAYQRWMALAGGQLEFFLMMGSVVCSAVLVTLFSLRRDALREEGVVFLLCVLAVYALPVLFGPSCLRMETARCWNWVAVVPVAFAARFLVVRERAGLLVQGAVAVSIATCVAMRLFLNFAP